MDSVYRLASTLCDEEFCVPPSSAQFEFVYFLRCTTTNLTKIGYTKNVKNRLSQLTIGPTELQLSMYTPTCAGEAALLETQLHEVFADKRSRGEWFALTDDDLDIANEYAVEYMNRACQLMADKLRLERKGIFSKLKKYSTLISMLEAHAIEE